jgi:hypothetical protein
MIQSILWTLFLAMVPTLLGITKEIVMLFVKTVEEAEELKDENGNKLPGAKKREYVLNRLSAEIAKMKVAQRVIDALIAISVNYVNFLLKSKPVVSEIQPAK